MAFVVKECSDAEIIKELFTEYTRRCPFKEGRD